MKSVKEQILEPAVEVHDGLRVQEGVRWMKVKDGVEVAVWRTVNWEVLNPILEQLGGYMQTGLNSWEAVDLIREQIRRSK